MEKIMNNLSPVTWPKEMVNHTASFCSFFDILNMKETCKEWHKIIKHPLLDNQNLKEWLYCGESKQKLEDYYNIKRNCPGINLGECPKINFESMKLNFIKKLNEATQKKEVIFGGNETLNLKKKLLLVVVLHKDHFQKSWISTFNPDLTDRNQYQNSLYLRSDNEMETHFEVSQKPLGMALTPEGIEKLKSKRIAVQVNKRLQLTNFSFVIEIEALAEWLKSGIHFTIG
jgi:hypothetical protein